MQNNCSKFRSNDNSSVLRSRPMLLLCSVVQCARRSVRSNRFVIYLGECREEALPDDSGQEGQRWVQTVCSAAHSNCSPSLTPTADNRLTNTSLLF